MLKDKTALITGSTQGIGLAIAQRLAHVGVDVILHGIEAPEIGNNLARDLAQKFGIRAAYVQANMLEATQAEGLVQAAGQALRVPNILVNNAGIQHTSPLESFPSDKWNAILAINLSANFYTMRAAVPLMRANRDGKGWGRIVNIASVHGLVASVNKSAYLAAKHGLVGLSKGVALETATQGITVNCICPGWTDTPLIEPQILARSEKFGGDRSAGVRDLLSEKQPNQVLVPPSDIGDTVVFLCSEAASGITGISLPVDGGWTAQ